MAVTNQDDPHTVIRLNYGFGKNTVLNTPTRNRHPVVFDTAVTHLLSAQVSSSFVRCV